MDNLKKTLENWLNELNSFSLKSYEELPDMNLYMEQVINYLERELHIYQSTSLDKIITPSMINNYVKGQVLPSPLGKKYNREHLALIEEIITLKQVLSINEIKEIEQSRYLNQTLKGDIFNSFNDLNNEKISSTVEEAFKKLNDVDDNDKDGMINLALDFALSANAYINISKRILFLLRAYENLNQAKKENEKEA